MRGSKARQLRMDSGLYKVSREKRCEHAYKHIGYVIGKDGKKYPRYEVVNNCPERKTYRRYKRFYTEVATPAERRGI